MEVHLNNYDVTDSFFYFATTFIAALYLFADVIVKEGAIGKKMYFIQQGLVEIRKSGVDDPIKQLADGSFFGGLRCFSVETVNFFL